MKKGTLLLLTAWVLGIAAGVIRSFELAYGFDAKAQLPKRGSIYPILLLVISALFAASAILLSSFKRHKREETNRAPLMWLILEAVGAAMLVLSSFFGLYALKAPDAFHIALLVFHLLGIISAGCIFTAAFLTFKGVLNKNTGFYNTIPIFWCCFTLVLDFWSHSSTPVKSAYIYVMLGLIFMTMAIQGVAGFFFDRPHGRRVLLCGAAGIFLSVLTLVSLACYRMLKADTALKAADVTIPAVFKFAFVALHMSALIIGVRNNYFIRPELPTPEKPEPEQAWEAEEIIMDAENEDAPKAEPDTEPDTERG